MKKVLINAARVAAIAGVLAAAGLAGAQTKEVTIGYQDMLVPYRIAQEAKAIETGVSVFMQKAALPSPHP